MMICQAREISKMYGGNTVFSNITFEINELGRIGLVGRNGGGKSTLLKLLSGLESPDSGQIHWKKGLSIGYLAQIPDYPTQMSGKDVLLTAFDELLSIEQKMKELERRMGEETDPDKLTRLVTTYGELQDQFSRAGGYEIEANIEKVGDGLQITPLLSKPFQLLSGGEKTKVGLALSLLKEPDLLLLDEPTNHLDLPAIEWLSRFLHDYNGTVVLVSHDRYFLDEVVTKIMDMEDGELHLYHHNYSGFVKEKEERLLQEFQAYQEQQKKIKKMKEAIKRLKEWANRANPPNEGLHKRARNMERALERMEKLDRPILDRKKIGIKLEAKDRSGADVIELNKIAKAFNNRTVFRDVSLLLQYKERAAIVGENGTGKSTLLSIILGQTNPDEGAVRIGSNVKIGYLAQHAYDRDQEMTVLDAFREEVTVTEGEARHILAKFLFYGHAVFRKTNQLSGGERMRLRLAQLMHQDINLLILDEPTNHLDIESREVLEEALEEFNGTILAVSHDRYFLNRLFEKIYWIENGVLHRFAGNYYWARQKMEEQRAERQVDIQPVKPPKRETATRQVPITESIETRLEQIGERIAELNKLLVVGTNPLRAQSLQAEKEQLESEEAALFEML